tara:strand:- start:685 stop:1785 length:1101 start_codon:yes stop_codon:yes gene_type:complete
MNEEKIQVEDDLSILWHMLKVTSEGDSFYKPTNYWDFYQKRFLPELKNLGLGDFRRRKNSILGSFNGTDLKPYPEIGVKLPRGGTWIGRCITQIINWLPLVHFKINGLRENEIVHLLYWFVKNSFEKQGLEIKNCSANNIGNPENICEIDGAFWTLTHLKLCNTFISGIKHFDFPKDAIVCELGTGMGRNIEIMASLYPECTFVMFDIPPQLYVANQYLKKVFEDRVIPFEQAYGLDMTDKSVVSDELKGKIIILPAVRMPMWSSLKINLFWNSDSFQEMEPDIVENYLNLVKKMNPEGIYINAIPEGNYWGKQYLGGGGTKNRVTGNLYKTYLSEAYELTNEFFTTLYSPQSEQFSYIFKNRKSL